MVVALESLTQGPIVCLIYTKDRSINLLRVLNLKRYSRYSSSDMVTDLGSPFAFITRIDN